MTIGLVGSGNMARALARGWGEPVLCTDSGSGRAQALAQETGGEALGSNLELARRADVIVLAHKPPQLQAVAGEIAAETAGKRVISVLARTALADLKAAYPQARVSRVEPNVAVEIGRGVSLVPEDEPEVRELFERVGAVIEVPEHAFNAAAAVSGVGPAYVALIAEAWADSAIRRGLPAAAATRLVAETLAGGAALLADRDTLAVRRSVTSPGGTTARGLAALEREGVRRAFNAAMDDVVDFR